MAEEEKKPEEATEANKLEVTEGADSKPATDTPEAEGAAAEGESLEDGVQDATSNKKSDDKNDDVIQPKKSLAQKVQGLIGGVNIYFLIFLLIILVAAAATFASFRASKKSSDASINGQNLSAEDLQKLKNTDTSVGDAKQTLTIASNAVFNGRVLVRDSLDVAGTIRIGGTLALQGITVSGTSAFENVQVGGNMSVAGNSAVQGQLTVQKDLTVGGNATFAGNITAARISIDVFTLNGDLQLNRHIDAGGPSPKVGGGSAIGGAGTVSISGTDTAGTININFGFGTSAGILANVTFTNTFNQTPHVVITPVGSNCASLSYYVNRTTGGFSVGTANAGPTGVSCAFDFIVVD
jgi:cytoskeletal protein CcmA (bactofilin family)